MNPLVEILRLLGTTGLWNAALSQGAVLLLPALGGVISERSGVVNIAFEGMMLFGVFFAYMADLSWHNPWLATLAAMLAGGVIALIHAVVSIRFRADQIVSGVAINIFAAGLTVFLYNTIFGQAGGGAAKYLLPTLSIPLLQNIPFLGPVLFQRQNVMVYIALILLVVVSVVLFRTKLGLRIRAVGEHPQAADTAGINVYAIRYGAVVTSGLLSGMAGAFLGIGLSFQFIATPPFLTSGRGYLALAAVIFGKWTPWGAFIACLIFGLGFAITYDTSFISISQYFLNMLPYVLVFVALAGLVGRSTPPAADGIPYEPGGE
jgi:simple sugar transport system permease protein